MKKYKYHFSFNYWNENVPKQIATLQLWLSGITAAGFISTSYAHYDLVSQLIAGAGFALNLLGHFIYAEEITIEEKK